MKIGDKFKIHCYKHNGKIYQTSDETIILDIKDEYIVCGNSMVNVAEKDNSYKTKELAIIFFYKNHWFNCIAQLKSFGLFYYCNIASPYIIEDGAIKYIDYDLDLRVFPDGSFKVLDCGEYKYHKSLMGYSKTLDMILKEELSDLIEHARNKDLAFKPGTVEHYYEIYKDKKICK